MQTLRTHIGGHANAAAGQLCLVEVSSLIWRAARVGGLRARCEVPLQCRIGTAQKTGEMDCGWYSATTAQWLVAWELDGRDVGRAHIEGNTKLVGNAQKFAVSTALLKVQVLYSLRNDLSPWGASQAARCRKILGAGVRVISDEDLMASGGIERYVNEARHLAGLPPLP